MTYSPNYKSVVVAVILLIVCGSMAYISYFSGEDHVARTKGLDELSQEFANKSNTIYDEELTLRSGEKKSMLDCENMSPKELELPRFLGSIPNITAQVGDDVSIPCVAENLGSYMMAWVMKLPPRVILTIQYHVITHNRRIGISMESQMLDRPCKNWSVKTTITTYTLNIDSVQKDDESIYTCQINTDPFKTQWGFLKVETPPQ